MLAKGLRNEHIGSAWDFSEALLALTIQYPQTNLVEAWVCYLQLFVRLLPLSSGEGDKVVLVQKCVLPLFEQYLKPVSLHMESRWITGDRSLPICSAAFTTLLRLSTHIDSEKLLRNEWEKLTGYLIEDM